MSDRPAPDGAVPIPTEGSTSPREADALYQNGRLVARAGKTEVDLQTKEVRFEEIHNSELLMIPEECEFQDYRILIQRIGYASKIQRGEEHKGRVLRVVVCDLLGYREK